MQRMVPFLTFVLLGFVTASAQVPSIPYSGFAESRFARIVRMGNAYTGFAEGAEATLFNPAGLARDSSWSITASAGSGCPECMDSKLLDVNSHLPWDVAVGLPLPFAGMRAGVIWDKYKIRTVELVTENGKTETPPLSATFNEVSAALSFPFERMFSIGAGVVFHSGKVERTGTDGPFSEEFSTIDLSVGAMYRSYIFRSVYDEFRLGVAGINVLNTSDDKMKLVPGAHKFRSISLGASYRITPYRSGGGRQWMGFLAGVEGGIKESASYDDRYLRGTVTAGLMLFEYVEVTYALEGMTASDFTDRHYSDRRALAYPAQHFGMGLWLPFQKLVRMPGRFETRLDIAWSVFRHKDSDAMLENGILWCAWDQSRLALSASVSYSP